MQPVEIEGDARGVGRSKGRSDAGFRHHTENCNGEKRDWANRDTRKRPGGGCTCIKLKVVKFEQAQPFSAHLKILRPFAATSQEKTIKANQERRGIYEQKMDDLWASATAAVGGLRKTRKRRQSDGHEHAEWGCGGEPARTGAEYDAGSSRYSERAGGRTGTGGAVRNTSRDAD